ncbi:MAG: hypothetical protein WCF68_20130 [Terriglobales bacterium]
MLAGMRSRFLLSFVVAFSVASGLPARAQMNGVPPSVTSIGFGGRAVNGFRPGVTSLGANNSTNSWFVFGNCCANFFLPANPNPLNSEHHRHHKGHPAVVEVFEPVAVPYAVPYAPDLDDDSADADSSDVPDAPDPGPSSKRPGSHELAKRDLAAQDLPAKDTTSEKPAPVNADEPVAAQPSTVLVFKDGHQSDVVNYAIVGDTLFDFATGHTRKILLADLDLPATRKANDDRGVDFQVPANPKGQ